MGVSSRFLVVSSWFVVLSLRFSAHGQKNPIITLVGVGPVYSSRGEGGWWFRTDALGEP